MNKSKQTILKGVLFLLLISYGGYLSAQITVAEKNQKISQIIQQIEKKSGYSFFFNANLSGLDKIASFNISNASIQLTLDKLFEDTNISYEIKEKQVILKEKTSATALVSTTKTTHKITGTVTDAKGEAIIGASVFMKGTKIGTVTNVEGHFSLNVTDQATLTISYIGYTPIEIKTGTQSKLEIKLQEDSKSLEEVVVVGYGAQKKVNMTGAVSSVKFDEMAAGRPILSASAALAGLSSGVTVIQNNGKPGAGATIRIRGIGTFNNSAPLVIVDGMEGSMDLVNPQDIESMSILKDAASASIYGSRAANGVILVTTKKGTGKRLSVTYSGNFSSSQPTNLLNFVSDYPTYMRLMNRANKSLNPASSNVFGDATIKAWEDANKDPNALNANGVPNYVAFPNTNWNDEMYNNSIIQDHTVSVSGATNNARFLLSAGYMDNPGLVNFTGMQRYSLRSNVELDINKWLTVGTRSYGSMTDTDMGNYDNMLNYMRQSTPGIYGTYNGKYGYPEAPEESATANNLYAMLDGVKGDDKSTRINSTLYSKVKLMKGLSWDFNFNYAKRFDEYNSHTNQAIGQRIKFSTGAEMSPLTSLGNMTTYYSTNSSYSYTLENILRYENNFGKHSIGALLGYNENYNFSYNYNANKKGLFDQEAYVLDAATDMVSINGSATDYSMRSFFGRVNYAYDQRYLVEANIRRDGSSRFQSDYRIGWFPSFSAGWRISEEGFMKNSNLFQNLKLRASWGGLGNNSIGNYDYMALYNPVNYSFNGIQNTGLRPGMIANNSLVWESTNVANIGLDATVLNGHMTIELEAYKRVTNNILTTPPIPATIGLIGAPRENTAEVTNKGFELTLGWKDKIGKLSYSISGNLGYNKNQITSYKGKLIEEWRTDAAGNPVYYSNYGSVSGVGVEDHMIGENFLLNTHKGTGDNFNADGTVNIAGGPRDGMIRTSQDMEWLNAMTTAGYKFMPNQGVGTNKIWYGDYIYADNNGDKIYGNSYDRKFTGTSTMPKFTFGSQMHFNWKDFDLNLIWSGQAGCKIYWLEGGYNSSVTRIGFQIGELVANDHYFYNEADPNDPANHVNATYPRLKMSEGDSQNTVGSTRWLYDGSFVRLKNLTLGYTLPKQISKKVSAERIRFSFSAENLFTISSFPGLDPEMGGNTNYPLMKQLSFGTIITF
jgi:TonB-linked SusC/RagA family outer membrane protein